MWQQLYKELADDDFTIVGLALDAEGIAPARRYYEKHGVTFPSLVDPNYATQFGAVPRLFFVNEHGVVLNIKDWRQQLQQLPPKVAVTDSIRNQWSDPLSRVGSAELARMVEANSKAPTDAAVATQLASRYIELKLYDEARSILARVTEAHNAKTVAVNGGDASRLLGQAYFQLMRCRHGDRAQQIRDATISYYLNPSIGFAKQIARIIDPQEFDSTPNGRLNNTFREATYQRLKRQRKAWLADR